MRGSIPTVMDMDNIPTSGIISIRITTVNSSADPVRLRVAYNFMGSGSSSGVTSSNLVFSTGTGTVLPGAEMSTIGTTYSAIGDAYLGEAFPIAEMHLTGVMTSRHTIQLKTLVFGFLSHMDIVRKHVA